MKKIAIMQPYYFPYVGYFELMSVVDQFVFLNDVQFKRGWINRNRIRAKDKEFQFLTIPVTNHHQTALISSIEIADLSWVDLHIKMIMHAFNKNPLVSSIIAEIESLRGELSLKNVLIHSLTKVHSILNLSCELTYSDGISCKKGYNKIIDICKHLKADVYVNLSGGKSLYDENDFAAEGLKLVFIEPSRFPNKFSIIDPIIEDYHQVKAWLETYENTLHLVD